MWRNQTELKYIKGKHAFSSRLKLTSRRLCRTLVEEYIKLIKLKEQSRIRKIADHEGDKGRIAEIFQRINQAREQLVVRISVIVVIFPVSLCPPSV